MGEAADATARRSTPSDRCLNRDVLAPVIGARRANRRFSRRKSALDRIVETDLVGNVAHSFYGSRVIVVLATYFGPPTRQNDTLAKRRDTLVAGTEARAP